MQYYNELTKEEKDIIRQKNYEFLLLLSTQYDVMDLQLIFLMLNAIAFKKGVQYNFIVTDNNILQILSDIQSIINSHKKV